MIYKKWLYFGIALILCCPIVGLVGTYLSINGSFDALNKAESAGIDDVGSGIIYAMIWTVLGLVGSIAGIALVFASVVKSKRA